MKTRKGISVSAEVSEDGKTATITVSAYTASAILKAAASDYEGTAGELLLSDVKTARAYAQFAKSFRSVADFIEAQAMINQRKFKNQESG